MNLRYRPEIDGLRAVAVLPVILFHAGFSTFSGGFVGVDVFFVISGYLITSIIVKDVEAGTFSFWEFYERRARRLLPALFLVLLCCIPFAWMWMMPAELKTFSNTLVSVIFFASNIRLWQQSGYFDTAGELKPLLHTWSLAVEEQFYIIFPIAILLLWRLGRRNVIWSIALVAVLSLALSEYASRYHPSFNFFWLPTRAWELMAGVLCSFIVMKPSMLRNNVLSLTGLTAVAVSVFVYDETIPFPSFYALLPVLGTCAILLFARQGTLVASLLSLKPFVGIGLISYSAYLWHQPLFAFARTRSLTEPTPQLMLLLAVVSITLAYFSWRFVEVPARKRGAWPLASRRTAFATLGVVAAALITAGMAGHFTKGFPSRLSPEVVAMAKYSDDGNPRMEDCHGAPIENSCIYGNSKRVEFAILGDSHASSLAFQLGKSLGENGIGLIEMTVSTCPPIHHFYLKDRVGFNNCGTHQQMVINYLKSHKEISTVVLFSRWTGYIELSAYNNGEGGQENWPVRGLVDNVNPSDDEELRDAIAALYQQSIRELLDMGRRVILVYPQPEVAWNVPQLLSKSLLYREAVDRPLSTSYDLFKERSRRAYAALDGIGENDSLIRIVPELLFCNTFVRNRCAAEDGKVPFYFDDDHVDSVGAALISKEIINAMQKKEWLD